MTTEMRLPRYMGGLLGGFERLVRCSPATDRRSPSRLRGDLAVRAARRERRPRGRLLARQAAPELSHLEARPLLQDGRHHAGVEKDVDGEEALVGAETLRLADEATRPLRLRPEPDPLEVVARVTDVPELAVDQELAGIHVAVREHRPAEVPRVARDLVLVLARDLRDQIVADDPLRVDEIREREVVVAGERAGLVLALHVVRVRLVLLDVEELRERLLRAAAREEREDRVDVEVLPEPVVVLDQHVLVVLGDRRLHLDAEVLVVPLDLAERLVRLDRALEEAGKDADLVVQRPDAVE